MPSPEHLRDAGMQHAENAADPRVIAAIDAAIERAIASGQRWSANTIRDQFPTVTSKGLVGARVRSYAARRPRVMTAVDREPSNLDGTNCAEIKVWVGVEHRSTEHNGRIVCSCGDFNCASLDGAA